MVQIASRKPGTAGERMKKSVSVIGGGLAGCEAALQIAKRGISVDLFEMRPLIRTPAHRTDKFAELVCSNSFGSLSEHTAPWILKRELEGMGSALLELAVKCAVPAGKSLAIDRAVFAEAVTDRISSTPQIQIVRQEVTKLPIDRFAIIATGPLTSDALAREISALLGQESLYFYDAISPIVSADSIQFDKLFRQSRYDKGAPDFWNIPLTQSQYEELVRDLLSAEVVLPHDFEPERYFEGCMPIEALAARGPRTLAFGPMKPVGLTDPTTGRRPHAVIQLRAENSHCTSYNLVGFQTKMKYGEQERVFRKLPGLENAEFLRLGSMHRNTYINSPQHILPSLQLRRFPSLLLAGQLTGTEGYVESIATGLVAGWNAANLIESAPPLIPHAQTLIGSLLLAVTDPRRTPFQPLNSNMGLLPPLPERSKSKLERNEQLSNRGRLAFDEWMREAPGRPNRTSLSEATYKHHSQLHHDSHHEPGLR